MRCALIAAVNNEVVLKSTLLNSPDIVEMNQIILKRGFSSASLAYNAALEECDCEIGIFAHQDVYLPPGWLERLRQAISAVESCDRNWAVLGVSGIDFDGQLCGHAYSTGLRSTFGSSGVPAVHAMSIDEMIIVVHTRSALRFDASLPGYHLYGTDICLEARRRKMSSYAISNFCIHNSNGIRCLPFEFWKAYLYLRRKWWDQLPILTPCVEITKSYRPFIAGLLALLKQRIVSGSVGTRVSDPQELYRRLLTSQIER